MVGNSRGHIVQDITIPGGYEIMSINVNQGHASTVVGMPFLNSGKLYIPYDATIGYASEFFTIEIFYIKI